MPSGDLRLEGLLVGIGTPAKVKEGYATNVTIDTGDAKMTVTILREIPEAYLGASVILSESYFRRGSERIFQQRFYINQLLEKEVNF